MSLRNPSPGRSSRRCRVGRLLPLLGLLALACGIRIPEGTDGSCCSIGGAEVGGGEPGEPGEPGEAPADPGQIAPRRIVPANSGAAELLLELIGPARLAALPITIEGYAHGDVADAGLPTFSHYTAENVLAFDPDLVVTHRWQSADASQVLERGGIPVLTLPDVGDFAGLCEVVRVLGDRVGATDEAARLDAELRARFAALQETERGAIRLVSYTNFGSGGWTAGAGTTADLLCELAGVRNLSADEGYQGHQSVDFETLLRWNPDVFLVGASGEEPGHSPSADRLRGEPSLATLDALRHGRILILPAELYTTNSHRIVDAAEVLARELDRMFPARD